MIDATLFAWLGRVILLLLFASIVVAILWTAVIDCWTARALVGTKLACGLILFVAVCLSSIVVWQSGPSIIAQVSICN